MPIIAMGDFNDDPFDESLQIHAPGDAGAGRCRARTDRCSLLQLGMALLGAMGPRPQRKREATSRYPLLQRKRERV